MRDPNIPVTWQFEHPCHVAVWNIPIPYEARTFLVTWEVLAPLSHKKLKHPFQKGEARTSLSKRGGSNINENKPLRSPSRRKQNAVLTLSGDPVLTLSGTTQPQTPPLSNITRPFGTRNSMHMAATLVPFSL
jgi:hypothetical protein